MKLLPIKTHKIAFVDTTYITENDFHLLNKNDCPFKEASMPSSSEDGYIILYVDSLEQKEQLKKLVSFGFSKHFTRIFKQFAVQDIQYMGIAHFTEPILDLKCFSWVDPHLEKKFPRKD